MDLGGWGLGNPKVFLPKSRKLHKLVKLAIIPVMKLKSYSDTIRGIHIQIT